MHKPHDKPEVDINYLKKLGYEPRDIDLPVIIKATIFLFAFFGLTAFATIGVFWLFVKQEVVTEKGEPKIARQMPPPDYPLLQESPVKGDKHIDIQKFRTEEDQRVNSPAWRDKQKGIVRIPVDKAMDILLQKGLPTRAAPSVAVSAPSDGQKPETARP